ncbi:MAG: hypothetical protein ABJN69_04745 [Hellea sp.]
MKAVIFGQYNNLPEACVIFSVLEAGGFHPSFQNYHHAHIAALQLMAFGGIILLIPEQELLSAKKFLTDQQSAPITDFDPIRPRRFGMWKRATLFGLASGIFLPMLFLAPELLMIIWLIDMGFSILDVVQNGLDITMLTGVWVFVPLMLLHAKHIAVPKLRETA